MIEVEMWQNIGQINSLELARIKKTFLEPSRNWECGEERNWLEIFSKYDISLTIFNPIVWSNIKCDLKFSKITQIVLEFIQKSLNTRLLLML